MRNFTTLHLLVVWAFSLALSGCSLWGEDDPPAPANSPPVSVAGSNQSVFTGVQVVLDGSGSSDPDGDLLSYAWSLVSKPAGSSASIINATSVKAALTPDIDGSYTVQLVVNDGKVDSAPASLVLTAATGNRVPMANAGPDQSVLAGATVTLDGHASSDPDGNPLTFAWSLTSIPTGSSAAISSATFATANLTPDVAGSYTVQLVVNDGTADSAADTVVVTVSTGNRAPVANAGPDQSVATGTQVVLNGDASSDPDGNPLTFAWSLTSIPTGSSVTISNATSATAYLTPDIDGNYSAQLVVNDGTVDSAADIVVVTAATGNRAPAANAGPDQSVATGTQVVLDGTASTDPDGNPLTYVWSLTGKPAGSSATIPNATSATAYLTPDVDGSYTVQLLVNDGTVDGAADTMVVTAAYAAAVEFPIAATSGREMSISAAFDGANYLVGIEGNQYIVDNITAQLVSRSTGNLVGSRISIGRTGGAPSVAFDGTNYMMVWPDDATSPNILYGQRISTTGQLLGPAFSIGQTYRNRGPIIFDGTNYFTIWDVRSDPNSSDTADIYGQFISPSGSLLGAAIPVSTVAHGQRDPALSFDGTNILAVWPDGRNQSACYTDTQGTHCPESDIYGQLITKSTIGAAGGLSGGNFLVNASSLPLDGYSVSVDFDGSNYFVVLVEETTLPNACPTSGCKWDVFGQFLTSAGVPIGSKVTISNTAPDHHFAALTWNGSKYLTTWTENLGSPATSIKGRYFDPSGTPIGSEKILFSTNSDGRIPWFARSIPNGSNYFTIINRGIPGADPFIFDAYTSQDVFGAFLAP